MIKLLTGLYHAMQGTSFIIKHGPLSCKGASPLGFSCLSSRCWSAIAESGRLLCCFLVMLAEEKEVLEAGNLILMFWGSRWVLSHLYQVLVCRAGVLLSQPPPSLT